MAMKFSIPVIKVEDMCAARQFYCEKLGFKELFRNQPTENPNPAYLGFRREGAIVHVSSFSGDGVAGTVVNLIVDDVDVLFEEYKNKGVTFKLEPIDQTWGVREMYIDDPAGNSLRFCQS